MKKIKVGDILEIDPKTGNLIPLRPYTLVEKAIRSLGRFVRIKGIAAFHQRKPIGIDANGRAVTRDIVRVADPEDFPDYAHR